MSIISLDLEEEKRIIEAARKDKEKFEPLYLHYKKYIEDFFKYRVNDIDISEELTSKVFEKAIKGLDNFQWQGYSFSAWIFRIARNTLVDHYRENLKNNSTTLDESLNIRDNNASPDQSYETLYTEELLYRILNELPVKEREIIYMKFFDGYTNRLISKLTGLSETNVGTILYRTIKNLRNAYKKH